MPRLCCWSRGGDYDSWSVRQEFDLERQRGLKAWLEGQTLVLAIHRLVADAASVDTLVEELLRAVAGLPLPAPDAQTFQQHAARQLAQLDAGALDSDYDYWMHKLADGSPSLALALDRPRTATRTYTDAQTGVELDSAALLEFCRHAGARPEQVLRAAFAVLLYRHTMQSNIRMATFDGGRSEGMGRVVGPFEKILVSSLTLDSSMRFAALLEALRAEDAANLAHAALPFDKLLERLNADGFQKHELPFQAGFVWRKHEGERPGPCDVVAKIEEDQASRMDLQLRVSESSDGRHTLLLSYAAALFNSSTAAALLDRLLSLLAQALAAPQLPLEYLRLVDAEMLERLSAPWPGASYEPVPVHLLMERHLALHGQGDALVCGDDLLSHADMHAAANRLAHHLIAVGVMAETRVGLALEHGVDMIVALLAVFKAGGALVPIDPAYPVVPRRSLRSPVNETGGIVLLTWVRFSCKFAGKWTEPLGLDQSGFQI